MKRPNQARLLSPVGQASDAIVDWLRRLGLRDPAYITDRNGTILGCNKAAERFLGCKESCRLHEPCYEVVRGRDLFGNRLCDKVCPVVRMVCRGEPVHAFELYVRTARGRMHRAEVSIAVVDVSGHPGLAILHILKPLPWKTRRPTRPRGPRQQLPEGSAHAAPINELTARQSQVLRLLAGGAHTGEIGTRLSLSPVTVRNHIQRILAKLHSHSRAEAVSCAYRAGVLSVPGSIARPSPVRPADPEDRPASQLSPLY